MCEVFTRARRAPLLYWSTFLGLQETSALAPPWLEKQMSSLMMFVLVMLELDGKQEN
tara:strand:- start:950 stop:1120 length:171 start_codon:yes stop_codon:yes gene_type:complete